MGGTWGKFGNGSWTGVAPGRPAGPMAPLGRARPALHEEEFQVVLRDDSPPSFGVPEAVTSGDRMAWLATGGGSPASDTDPGDHYATGPHTSGVSAVDLGAAEPELEFVHVDVGGHRPPANKGAAGAAHGGLRGDSAAVWSNPGGFPLGTDYDPVNMLRPMFGGRMRPALRGVAGPFVPETGSTSSPPPVVIGRTSPYDPVARRKGFGPEPTTARHVARAVGDEPVERVNFGTIGEGFMK